MEYVKIAFYVLVLALCFLTTVFTMRVVRDREEAVKTFVDLSKKLNEANEKTMELNERYEAKLKVVDEMISILEQITKYNGGGNEEPR